MTNKTDETLPVIDGDELKGDWTPGCMDVDSASGRTRSMVKGKINPA